MTFLTAHFHYHTVTLMLLASAAELGYISMTTGQKQSTYTLKLKKLECGKTCLTQNNCSDCVLLGKKLDNATDALPEHLKRVFMQEWRRTFPTLTSLSNRKCSLTGSKVATEPAVISVLNQTSNSHSSLKTTGKGVNSLYNF